jgi:glyoxylase-like metal-dependent hydrolase (beta-lactamase superfamily II)
VGVAERVRKRSGAGVYIHPEDEAMSGCRNGGFLRGTVTLLGLDWGPKMAVDLLRNHCLPYPRVAETVAVADGEVLDLPGKPRVIALPGHTPGSIAFHFEASSTLFSGDALTTYTRPDGKVGCSAVSPDFDEDPEMSLESMNRLEGVQAGLILPGHGPDFTDGVDRAVKLARDDAAAKDER